MVPTLVGGDLNSHLDQTDSCKILSDGEIIQNNGQANGVLRNFLIVTGFNVASDKSFTHEQRLQEGMLYSRKDYILTKGAIETILYDVLETSSSDHKILQYKCRINGNPNVVAEDEDQETLRPRHKDGMRKYTDSKKDFFSLYSKYRWTDSAMEVIYDIFYCRSLQIQHLRSKRFRICWTNPTEAYENVRLFLSSAMAKERFSLGKCFYRIQLVQENLRMPENFESFSLNEQVEWIHSVIEKATDQVTRRKTKRDKRDGKKCDADMEHDKWVYYKDMVQLLWKATYFKENTPQRKRIYGLIRQRCPSVHLHRPSQVFRLLDYFTKMKTKKEKLLKSKTFKKRTATKRYLKLGQASLKRMFDDILDKNIDFDTELQEQHVEEVDYKEREDSVKHQLQNWVTPMDPKAPEIGIADDSETEDIGTPLEQLRNWVSRNNMVNSPALWNQLYSKNVVTDWTEVIKPVTVKELDDACKNRDSAPGYSRITYRMLLYSVPKIKETVVKVMSKMLSQGTIPDHLKIGLIRPIPKSPGVPTHVECRPIILLEVMWKAFTIILSKRLQSQLQQMQLLLPSAHGFISSKKLCTPIIVKQMVEEHARKQEAPLLSAELDISKAYDFTRQHVLVAAMDRLQFPTNLIRLVKSLTSNTRNFILSDQRIIGESRLNTLRQGDPFSCLLFVIQLDILLCAIDTSCMGYQLKDGNKVSAMAYADDICTFHSTEDDAQNTISLCGEFFRLNNQKVNPRKSLIKKINVEREIEVIIYGKALPTVEGQSCSRYLGVWLQSDGGIQSSRRKLDELLARFRNLLQTKTCSVYIRSKLVNMVLFPKMLHILGNMCWRQQDLDKYEKKVKNLISKDADISMIFGSTSEGGMGIKSPKLQSMTTLLQSVLMHINRNDEERIAKQWIKDNSTESTNVWRERHFNITSWTYQLLYELAIQEAQEINTRKNPLGIPVTLFITKKDSSMELIRTMREYLTSMKLTLFDTHATQLTHTSLELYDVLPANEAFQLAVKKQNWAQRNLVRPADSLGYTFSPQMIWNGWLLNPENQSLRKSMKTARRLTNTSGSQSGTMDQLVKNPVRTNVVPTNQCLQRWSVVGYDIKQGSYPELGIIYSVDVNTVDLIPVAWKGSTEAKEVFQASVMAPIIEAGREQVVEYSPASATRYRHGWEVTINQEYWKRDCNVVVMELIRRKYAESSSELESETTTYSVVPLALRELDDQILDIYTDGSLTERDGIIHMGAAAVIHRNNRILGQYACAIPPVNTHQMKKIPGTTKPETIGAALGAWIAYKKHFRACNLIIDNLAVVNALREKHFERLVRFDPHAGVLLEELDKRCVLNKIKWIKGHQKSSSVQSLANERADEIAEAARRRAKIAGSYEKLPLLPHHELQIVPMKDGGEFEIPQNRSTTIKIPKPIVPDASAILQGWTNKDILDSQQAHAYPLTRKGSSPIDDTPEEITISAMSLRIKSGLLPISGQKLVDRPDVFGRSPPCPACRQLRCFSSSMAGWKHLLFECQIPTIRRSVTKFVQETDQRILEEAIYSLRQKKWDKSSLTEVDSSNDCLEQCRSCRKCVIPRMVLNAKAGDTTSRAEEKTRYRLDLYQWFKTNNEVYKVWQRLLDEFDISLDITMLDALLTIFVEKEANICIKELEPTHVGPSIWLKPKSKAEVENEFGIRAINWSPVLAITSPLCWWNFDVITGKVCRHKDSLPQGVVVYVKRPNTMQLERLRTLWKSCYVKNSSGMDQGSRDIGIWINGSDASSFIKDVPGIQSSTMYANVWISPSEHLKYHPTHWWLGRNEEDLILWYQGRLRRGDTMQRNLLKFSRVAQRIENHFRKRYNIWCKENDIDSPVLWDRQHYREFQQRPQNVTPYIELTAAQKKVYKHVLAQNRRAIAANQSKTISITDNLPAG